MNAVDALSEAEVASHRHDFFFAMERAVAEELATSGYSIIRHDSQLWPVSYSICGANTGGAVALFFGPLRESAKGWTLPYEVVHEGESREGQMRIHENVTPELAAALFLQGILGILRNRLSIPQNVGVGAGLLSVEEATKMAEAFHLD